MSAKETPGAQDSVPETSGNVDDQNGQDDSSVANKLSKELSNWRRQRHGSRPKRPSNGNAPEVQQSEPARTIKVRGHETLVVRKPKLVPKPPSADPASDNG